MINKAKMNTFNGKISLGDTISMKLNRNQGDIRWYCNDIEVAVATLDHFKHENLYPMIGLGHMFDEVELTRESEVNNQ